MDMPLYLDRHEHVEGLSAKSLAEAHARDLQVQSKYGAHFQKYWFNEDEGMAFCLVDAPSKEAAAAVHREAHGLVATEITEVEEGR
jgi:hypothetical protein